MIFFFNDTATTEIYTLSLHDALPIFENNGKKIHYKIVGTPEADVAQGLISNESPIGSALLGHKVGEIVDVKVPSGIQTIKIVNID